MSFLNSCISIFSKKYKEKKFVYLFLLLILFILIFSVLIKRQDINMNSNDLIKSYQINKIEKFKFQDLDTIIVGDSSAGNAIDSKLFSELSRSKTINLSLTGSWGILGSLGIIKKVLKKKPYLKNVIIIQTLDIWNRPFAKDSVHELFSFDERLRILGLKSIISSEVNVKEIKWSFEYLLKKVNNKKFVKIDYTTDYLKQKQKQKSNFKEIRPLEYLSSSKIKEYNFLEKYCNNQKLNCIFLNGPIYKKVIEKSDTFLKEYNVFMKSSRIQYIDSIFMYPNYMMGDAEDHILPIYKNRVTKEYFNKIKKYLK